jgi:hypothetical protein
MDVHFTLVHASGVVKVDIWRNSGHVIAVRAAVTIKPVLRMLFNLTKSYDPILCSEFTQLQFIFCYFDMSLAVREVGNHHSDVSSNLSQSSTPRVQALAKV